MLRTIITPILLLLLLLTACSNPEVDARLMRVEQLMESHPDSALAQLDDMATVCLANSRRRAHYALLYSQALDKNYIDVTNDSLINIAVEYYEKHPDNAEQLFLSYYYKARVLENGGNILTSVNYLVQAEPLIELFDNDLAKGLLYARMGRLYNKTNELEKSLDAYRKALSYYKNGSFDTHINYTLFNLGEILVYIKKYEEALECLLLYKEWSLTHNRSEYWKCLILLATIYEYTNDINALSNVLKEYKSYDAPNIYITLAEAYVEAVKNNANISMQKIKTADSLSTTLNDSVNLIFYKYRINKILGNYQTALYNCETLFHLQDSIIRMQLQQPLVTIQRDFYKNRVQNKELQVKNNMQRLIILYIVLLLIFMSVVVIILSFLYYIKKKQQEVSSYIHDVACLQKEITQKDDAIDQMTFHVKKLFSTHFELIDELITAFYDNDKPEVLSDKIKSLTRQVGNNKIQMAELEKIVNEYKDNVMSIIRQELTQLSDCDYRILCYLYAGFSVKAICVLTGISPNYLYSRKHRIRKQIEKLSPYNRDILLSHFP